MAKTNGSGHQSHGPVRAPLTHNAEFHGGLGVSQRIVETHSALLPDGRILDLVRDSRSPAHLQFLVWQDGASFNAAQMANEDAIYAPPKLHAGILSALRLPTGPGPCPNTREIFNEVEARIQSYFQLREEDVFLITAFIMSTWFSDRLTVLPYVTISGPPECGKTTLLRLLHCLTRRGIHVGDVTRASLYTLPSLICPTLLMDEADFGTDKRSHDIQRLLRTGNRRGVYVMCNRQALETFCPKVVASRIPLLDAALASRAIHVVMTPSRQPLPTLDTSQEEVIAAGMQPKLLAYRLVHFAEVHPADHLQPVGMTPRVAEMARALAAAMLGDSSLEERLLRCLRAQEDIRRAERHAEPEYIVMQALYRSSHARVGEVFVSGLASDVNQILELNGDYQKYTPKKVGVILNKSLGFTTKRSSLGYYIRFGPVEKGRVHKQAADFGLTKADIVHPDAVEAGYGGAPCSLCEEYGLTTLEDGRVLRCVGEGKHKPRPRPGSLFDYGSRTRNREAWLGVLPSNSLPTVLRTM